MRITLPFLVANSLLFLGACRSTGETSPLLTVLPVENDGMHERNVMLAERAGQAKDAQLVFFGDRTEHVLWRLATGAYDHLRPKLIVIMIGTNNTGHRMDPPADIAAGIDAILSQLSARFPEAKLALLAIFPRGETPADPMRVNNSAVNARLPAIAAAHGAELLDLASTFTDTAGNLPTSVMPDLLHLSPDGYSRWATALRDPLSRWMR